MYPTGMLSDEDLAWLKTLQGELYPPQDTRSPGEKLLNHVFPETKKPDPPKPRGKLSRGELERIVRLVREANLLTVLFPHGPICGVGMNLFDHEAYPGTGPVGPLLSILDEHLPPLKDRTWYAHLLGMPKAPKKKRLGGEVDYEAWDFFTSFTHSEKNREWLKHYRIKMNFDKTYYDY